MKNLLTKPKFILSALSLLTLLAVASAVAFNLRNQPVSTIPPGAKIFQVQGQVRSIDAEAKIARIAHEEIADYMDAMTMPFTVKEASLLKGLVAGDSVQFQLVVTEDDSWISH